MSLLINFFKSFPTLFKAAWQGLVTDVREALNERQEMFDKDKVPFSLTEENDPIEAEEVFPNELEETDAKSGITFYAERLARTSNYENFLFKGYSRELLTELAGGADVGETYYKPYYARSSVPAEYINDGNVSTYVNERFEAFKQRVLERYVNVGPETADTVRTNVPSVNPFTDMTYAFNDVESDMPNHLVWYGDTSEIRRVHEETEPDSR